MLDWNEYSKSVRARAGEFGALAPEAMSGFRALGSAPQKHLSPKMHELIALSVAVTTRCDGCIGSHVQAALKHGATREEIAEALSTAIALNAGAAFVYTTRVLDAVDAFDK